jgi:hypothetical protein
MMSFKPVSFIVYMLLRNGGNSRIQGFNGKDCIQTAKETGLKDIITVLPYNLPVNFNSNSLTKYQNFNVFKLFNFKYLASLFHF